MGRQGIARVNRQVEANEPLKAPPSRRGLCRSRALRLRLKPGEASWRQKNNRTTPFRRPPLGRHRRRHRDGRRDHAVHPGRAELPGRLAAPVRLGALGRASAGPGRTSEIVVEDAATADYSGLDIVFFSAGGETSRASWRRRSPPPGAIVIDNSSAWRSDPEGPAGGGRGQSARAAAHSQGHRRQPQLHDHGGHAGAEAAAQGGGPEAPGGQHLPGGVGRGLAGDRRARRPDASAGVGATALVHDGSAVDFPPPAKWAVPIAFNVVPLNYRIVEDGYTEEEVKLRDESRKILEIPDLPVSGTCVRVPVYTGHSLSINAEFERPLPVAEALELLRAAPGVVLSDVPNPLEATGRDAVFVGRVRPRSHRPARPRAVRHRATTCARARRSTRCRSPSCCRRGRRPAGGARWKRRRKCEPEFPDGDWTSREFRPVPTGSTAVAAAHGETPRATGRPAFRRHW